MGKAQKKTGKGRLDKYYKLAKEQGYRARSAFKLIQLNKKYSFLESARCCIDLCAAPGGWLQVVSKTMPVNSLIVGVDLVPIKPIPRVTTFAADITTVHCRNLLRNELKDWKADVVLHDGAPNVGTAWIQDAYAQSELVLMSLKLAVDFLIKGGTFVTKVFRSKDYNSLIWVFNQLFNKVEATKPPSSRNVSAEIFVVCREFLAPKAIDPKFLDPKHVFKDLEASAPLDKGVADAQANVFQPDKKRRHRGGYADNDYTLFKQIGVEEFIRSSDPIAILGAVNKMNFTTEEEKSWASLPLSSEDIKANLDDLKVLGKGDFKALLKWRTALREELGLEVKTKHVDEFTEAVEVVDVADEDEQIQQELERLNTEAASRAKRERRKANEVKTKTIQRMQLQMTAPLDIGLEQTDAVLGHGQEDVFDLESAERISRRIGSPDFTDTDDQDNDIEQRKDDNSSDDEALDTDGEQNRRMQALENDLDGLYETYRERLAERDAKYKVRMARQDDKRREEWSGIDKDGAQGDTDEEDEGGGWDEMEQRKAAESDSDSSSADEEDKVSSSQSLSKRKRPRQQEISRKKTRLLTSLEEPQTKIQSSKKTDVWFSQDIFGGLGHLSEDDDGESTFPEPSLDVGVSVSEDDELGSQTEFEVVPQEQDDTEMWDVNNLNEDELKSAQIREHGLLTAEAVSLAQELVNRRKTKTELINDGFTRYSLNSKEGLPSWFLDDESKHFIPNIPITKEAVQALRAKQRALDVRPIKKVAEAKARKKFKAAQRLEKALKKAEGVTRTTDLTEREKAQQVEKLMRRGLAKNKKKEVKVVVAKGVHKGLKGRPKGVKGRYVMVDPRMRKEMRAKKAREKEGKKRKRS